MAMRFKTTRRHVFPKAFPCEGLRAELAVKLGLVAEEHEVRALRTLAYRKRLIPREGATADELASLLLRASGAQVCGDLASTLLLAPQTTTWSHQ